MTSNPLSQNGQKEEKILIHEFELTSNFLKRDCNKSSKLWQANKNVENILVGSGSIETSEAATDTTSIIYRKPETEWPLQKQNVDRFFDHFTNFWPSLVSRRKTRIRKVFYCQAKYDGWNFSKILKMHRSYFMIIGKKYMERLCYQANS